MIQRIQSLWLLVAAVLAFLTLKFPFYIIGNNLDADPDFNAVSRTLLLMLTSILGALCIINIFFFKQRKIQLRLAILALVISLLNLFLYFYYTAELSNGGIALSSVFAFAIPIFIFLAIRGIYKDQKLLKSMDRLR